MFELCANPFHLLPYLFVSGVDDEGEPGSGGQVGDLKERPMDDLQPLDGITGQVRVSPNSAAAAIRIAFELEDLTHCCLVPLSLTAYCRFQITCRFK